MSREKRYSEIINNREQPFPPQYVIAHELLIQYLKEASNNPAEYPEANVESAELIIRILQKIDKQTFENFRRFDSSLGVGFGHVSIDISSIALEVLHELHFTDKVQYDVDKKTGKEKHQKKLIFPGIGSDAFDRLDWVYETVFNELGPLIETIKAGKPIPHVTLDHLGLPHKFGGIVSQQWIQMYQEHGFEAYAALYKEFFNAFYHRAVEKDNQIVTQVTTYGTSMGTINARLFLRHLLSDYPDIELENRPHNAAGYHQERDWVKTGQLAIGSGLEHVIRSNFDKFYRFTQDNLQTYRDRIAHKAYSREEWHEQHQHEQRLLKKECIALDVAFILHGLPYTEEDAKLITTVENFGIWDPTTTSWRRVRYLRPLLRGEEIQGVYKGRQVRLTLDTHHDHKINNFNDIRHLMNIVNGIRS